MKRYISFALAVSFVLVLVGTGKKALAQPPQPQDELERRLKALRQQIDDLKQREQEIKQQLKQSEVANAERKRQYFKVEARGMLRQRSSFGPGFVAPPGAAPPAGAPGQSKVWILRVRDSRWRLKFDEKHKELQKKCETLKGQPVIIKGVLKSVGFAPSGFPGGNFVGPANGVIELHAIHAAPKEENPPPEKTPAEEKKSKVPSSKQNK